MNQLHIALVLAITIVLGTLYAIAPANAIDATVSGSTLSVTGSASPGEQVSMRSSFTMNLPVRGGQYEYETSVQIPQEPNRFQVTARNVKDFNAGVKMGIWITKSFQANGGTASISRANVPSGRYNIKLFGEALPGSSAVPVEVAAETQVRANSNGKYNLDIDTSAIPAGEYKIEVAGETKTIQIGGSSPDTSTSSGPTMGISSQDAHDATSEETSDQKAMPVTTTSEVIHWYANETGRPLATLGEYQETEKQLRKRLAGGYWKVIRHGDPLTEQAGNCEQEYCLVRDKDACTVCREKDILLNSGRSQAKTDLVTDSKNSNDSQSSNESWASGPVGEEGLMERVGDWVNQLLEAL